MSTKYSKAEPFTFRGLPFTCLGPMCTGDGRYRMRVSLLHPTTSKCLEYRSCSRASPIEALEQRDVLALALWQKYKNVIFEITEAEQLRELTIGQYLDLRVDTIRVNCSWAGKYEKYIALWNSQLKREFGDTAITQFDDPNLAKQKIENIFHREKRKTRITAEESLSWTFLNDVFNQLVLDGLIKTNPVLEKSRQYKRSENEKALREIACRSMEISEARTFVQICSQRAIENPLYNALLLCLTLCLRIEEVCALNLADVITHDGLYWLEITKEYCQSKPNPPYMKTMLDSVNQYRRAMCTKYTLPIIARQFIARKTEGATPDSPLFVEAGSIERATPDSIKKLRKELLTNIMHSPLAHSNHDKIRGTAEFHLRKYCEVSPTEMADFFGIDRVTTYGIHYVDWNNTLLLLALKSLLEHWHEILFGNATPTVMTKTIVSYLVHMNEGDSLSVTSKSGCDITMEDKYNE